MDFNYNKLTPFKWFVLQNFPFIDEDFDAITNYQMFCKLGEEINKLIESQNLTGEQVETLTTAFNTLKDYVDNYFDNLDVTEEISNKLDEMAQDGTLTNLIKAYIDPIQNAFENSINGIINVQNENIENMQNSVNIQNTNIASQNVKIETLKSRMDEFTNLTEGSTTGDAELADIRTGFNGDSFTNAGDAVRAEDSYNSSKIENINDFLSILDANWEIGAISNSDGSNVDSDYCIRTTNPIDLTRFSKLYIEIRNTNYKLQFYWYDANGDLATSTVFNVTATRWLNSIPYPKARLLIISNPYTTSLLASLSWVNYARVCGNPDLVNLNSNFTNLFRNNSFAFNNKIKLLFNNTSKKLKYIIDFKNYSNNNVIASKNYYKNIDLSGGAITGEINYPNSAGAYYVYLNTSNQIAFTTDITTITNNDFIIYYGLMSSSRLFRENTTIFSTENTFIDNISVIKKFNNISLLGDSWTTFENWTIPGNRNYYPLVDPTDNNVTDVSQTYWYKLLKAFKSNLLINDSYGGSTICYNVRPNHTRADSFISRMINSLGVSRITESKPDLILILGGINDTAQGGEVGTPKYSNWTDSDLEKVIPAFCYMIDYIQTYNPTATIINISADSLSSEIKEGMAESCTHYGIKNIVLSSIDKMSGHPDQDGMNQIVQQIIEQM